MDYIVVAFFTSDETQRELLMAELTELNASGFEEKETELHAYMDADHFEEQAIEALALTHDTRYTVDKIPEQNWNATWEANFQPVIVEDFVTVRADFHDLEIKTPYEIKITPKMSFGTGHHATTQLMMMQMKNIDFNNKSVLDFGTGTGILAILAEMLGASNVIAIDNDEWSYSNAIENLERNEISNIEVKLGTLESQQGKEFEIILANINRHILLQYMADMYTLLKTGGILLMSGLLAEDENIVAEAAKKAGFIYKATNALNNWIVLYFEK